MPPPPSLKNVRRVSLEYSRRFKLERHHYRYTPRSSQNILTLNPRITGGAYPFYVHAQQLVIHVLTDRNLSAWATSGVLLLNTCLTVRAHEAGSHSNKGWEQFTDRVVDVIDRYGGANLGGRDGGSSAQNIGISRGVVFLAWGSWAQKRVARLDKARVWHLSDRGGSPSDPTSS